MIVLPLGPVVFGVMYLVLGAYLLGKEHGGEQDSTGKGAAQ